MRCRNCGANLTEYKNSHYYAVGFGYKSAFCEDYDSELPSSYKHEPVSFIDYFKSLNDPADTNPI